MLLRAPTFLTESLMRESNTMGDYQGMQTFDTIIVQQGVIVPQSKTDVALAPEEERSHSSGVDGTYFRLVPLAKPGISGDVNVRLQPLEVLDIFEKRTLEALEYAAKAALPMLYWLVQKTENNNIRLRVENPSARRQISQIISSYISSQFFTGFTDRNTASGGKISLGVSALQVAERQIDCPIAGYYFRAHPEIAACIAEDWGADHSDNLRRTSASHGDNITDPGSFYLEVIAPELIQLWIMEDLTIDKEAAALIQGSSQASNYGRLVLDAESIRNQDWHYTTAHSKDEGKAGTGGRERRKRKPPIRM